MNADLGNRQGVAGSLWSNGVADRWISFRVVDAPGKLSLSRLLSYLRQTHYNG